MARDMDWEMTDAERRKELLDELRSAAFYRGPEFSVCDKAADEIERLAALPQPDAETESYGDQLRRVMKRLRRGAAERSAIQCNPSRSRRRECGMHGSTIIMRPRQTLILSPKIFLRLDGKLPSRNPTRSWALILAVKLRPNGM
jgi:hypothetical protein